MSKCRLIITAIVIGLTGSNAFAAYVNAAFPKETVAKPASPQANPATLKGVIQPGQNKIRSIQ